MVNEQKIIWTVLPNGTEKAPHLLKLSVLVSPRLYAATNTTLAQFPDSLHWPQRLARIHFHVRFQFENTSVVLPAKPDPASPKPDEARWEALFGGQTLVRGYQFNDYSQRFINSPPIGELLSILQRQYQSLAIYSPTSLPNIRTLYEIIGARELTIPENGNVDRPGLDQWLARLKSTGYARERRTFPPPGGAVNLGLSAQAQTFLEFRLFHHRPAKSPSTTAQSPETHSAASPQPQSLDIHEMVSALTKYPDLLRYLGLVVDLIVPYTPKIPQNQPDATVQIVPTWLPPAPTVPKIDITPQTAYTLVGDQFFATPASSEIEHGLLNLADQTTFGLVQVDVDGAALKMVGLADALQGMISGERVGTPQQASVPSLRSSGIAVFETGRASDLAQTLSDATSNNTTAEQGNGSSLVFHAEDLTRGYRADVWDSKSTTWHSLCQRHGNYQFINATKESLSIDDEGFVSLGVTQDPSGPSSGGSAPDLYLTETLFRWSGWSLSAPRPGKNIDPNGNPGTFTNTPGPGVGLVTDFTAIPKSLPRLRFGTGYRVRARVVDLAGNSLPAASKIDDPAIPSKSAPLIYGRFEPVAAPVLVLHDSLDKSPGESIARLVVRSNVGLTTDQYIQYLAGKGFTGFLADSQRHIAPPQTSQLMAEQHGMFDGPPCPQDKAAYPSEKTDAGVWYQVIVHMDGAFNDTAYNVDQLTLPYLPDPLAQGAAFFGDPNAPPGTNVGLPGMLSGAIDTDANFPGCWPHRQPFRLVLKGIPDGQTPAHPQWDATTRTLTVQLPQAEVFTVRLSSYIKPSDLELLGIWQWIEQTPGITPAQLDKLRKFATQGLIWLLTPFRELTLVHAVQQPLIPPTFQNLKLVAQKGNVGQTFATLVSDPMPISGKSTMKLDVLASWQEPIDDPIAQPCPQPGQPPLSLPTILHGQAHAFEVPIEPTDTQLSFTANDNRRHQFGDTKYRRVTYTAVGTTRFREYLPEEGVANGTLPITSAGPSVEVDVLNSARPDAPNLLYVVPAFEWSTQRQGNVTKSVRLGGRLRVYMKRPWFSSGDGELLGVVLLGSSSSSMTSEQSRKGLPIQRIAHRLGRASQLSTGVPDTLKPYVTQWGMDPIWSGPALTDPPSIPNFPLAVKTQDGLSLAELSGVQVAVAGHRVAFDATRCLWYSDIELNWGTAYYPFVRLALARYQPNSISTPDTVHLSRVVLADFAQLAPHRIAVVQTKFDANDLKKVLVEVHGFTYRGSVAGPGGSQMEVTVEEPMPHVTGELGWVPVPNATYQLAVQSSPSGSTVWRAIFDLPQPPGSKAFRLVIKEYELFITDASRPTEGTDLARRLVYASAVEV
jgi:hypothetical protein